MSKHDKEIQISMTKEVFDKIKEEIYSMGVQGGESILLATLENIALGKLLPGDTRFDHYSTNTRKAYQAVCHYVKQGGLSERKWKLEVTGSTEVTDGRKYIDGLGYAELERYVLGLDPDTLSGAMLLDYATNKLNAWRKQRAGDGEAGREEASVCEDRVPGAGRPEESPFQGWGFYADSIAYSRGPGGEPGNRGPERPGTAGEGDRGRVDSAPEVGAGHQVGVDEERAGPLACGPGGHKPVRACDADGTYTYCLACGQNL